MNGVRSCGYLFLHLMNIRSIIPSQLLSPFTRVRKKTIFNITMVYFIII